MISEKPHVHVSDTNYALTYWWRRAKEAEKNNAGQRKEIEWFWKNSTFNMQAWLAKGK